MSRILTKLKTTKNPAPRKTSKFKKSNQCHMDKCEQVQRKTLQERPKQNTADLPIPRHKNLTINFYLDEPRSHMDPPGTHQLI